MWAPLPGLRHIVHSLHEVAWPAHLSRELLPAACACADCSQPALQFKERPYAQAGQWSEIEAMRDAVTAALEAAACQRSEIDLVIYCGCEKCAPLSPQQFSA